MAAPRGVLFLACSARGALRGMNAPHAKRHRHRMRPTSLFLSVQTSSSVSAPGRSFTDMVCVHVLEKEGEK